MIVKGNTRGGAGWAQYLKGKANERVEVLEVRGTNTPDDLAESILEMCAQAELQGVKKTMMAVSINPDVGPDKAMTTAEKLRTADIAEEWLNLTGHRRFIVEHEKIGKDGVPRVHLHVGWERWDYDTNKLVSDSYMRYSLVFARLQMETELGHEHAPTHRTRATERSLSRNKEDMGAHGRVAEQVAEKLLQAATDTLKEIAPEVAPPELKKPQSPAKQDRFDRIAELFARNKSDKIDELAKQILAEQKEQEKKRRRDRER